MIVEYGLELSTGSRHPLLVQENCYEYDGNRLDDPEKIQEVFKKCFFLHIKAEEFVYAAMLDQAMHPLGIFEIHRFSRWEGTGGGRVYFKYLQ